MISTPTVFVLGAGASHPYQFPLGTELVDKVIAALGEDNASARIALRHAKFADSLVATFVHDLRKARPLSIDRFLTWQPDFARVGKAAMAAVLVPCELDKRLGQAAHADDWYRYLFAEMLGDGPDDFRRNRLSIVTFNFDRSFERALFRTLQQSYGIDAWKAAELCSCVPVVHVHGQLGAPNWLGLENPHMRAYEPNFMAGPDHRKDPRDAPSTPSAAAPEPMLRR